MKKLESESKDENLIRDQIDYRVRWIKHQEAKKQKEEAEAERERVSYAQVDWHGFVVVETVDYQPWEVGNFPPPTNPTDVGARVLMQRRIDADPQSAKIKPQGESANTQVEDMDEDSSEESTSEDDDEDGPENNSDKDSQPKPPALPTPGNVEVRKYDPKAAKSAKKVDPTSQEFLISPITGERIPADQVQEHMRIGLLDPRWVEERDKQITARAAEEQVYAPGRAIESNLKQLAERRTDIFGVGEEAALEAAIGKKMGEEEKREEKVTWDGHSSSAESTSRAARATISISEQIEQIHRSKGLLPKEGESAIGPTVSGPKTVESAPPPQQQQQPPPPPSMRLSAPPVQTVPMSVPMMPRPVAAPPVQAVMMAPNPGPPAFFMAAAPPVQPAPPPFQMAPEMMMGGGGVPPRPDIAPPPHVMPPMEPEEPPNKRPRGEDNLIPEGEFMARNPNPVTFHILCPIINDKPEWRLTGQSIALTLGLGETVTAIKGRIHDETGLPPGKQKLQLDSMFLKDGNTLAYYNVRPGMAMGLQIKERGGRKK